MRQSLAKLEALALSAQATDVKWSALVEDTVSTYTIHVRTCAVYAARSISGTVCDLRVCCGCLLGIVSGLRSQRKCIAAARRTLSFVHHSVLDCAHIRAAVER